jgi:acetyl esterase/lipase
MLSTTAAVRAQVPGTAPPSPPYHQPPHSSELPLSVQQDVPYSTIGGQQLRLDIYGLHDRSSDLRPAVIVIHGGGWTSYDKSSMREESTFLARCGFVAFAIDYRLTHGSENLWPAQLDDVQRAVRWIRAHAAQFGVDRDRIGALGYSAGGQLAALLGMEDTRDNSDPALAKYSSRVEAVVDISGPSDFTTNRDAESDAFLTTFFGGDYAHRSEVWQYASPVFHVSKKAAPFLIVHGIRDANVPIAQAEELAARLKQARVPVEFLKVDEGHDFETPDSQQRLTHETRNFLVQYLRLGN